MRWLVVVAVLSGCGEVAQAERLADAAQERSTGSDAFPALCAVLICPKPLGAPAASAPGEYGMGCTCIEDSACVARESADPNVAHLLGCRRFPQFQRTTAAAADAGLR